jgi:hypothetical protein
MNGPIASAIELQLEAVLMLMHIGHRVIECILNLFAFYSSMA